MTTRNISGIFLPFYVIVAISISLSYIHIEGRGGACSLVNSTAPRESSPHLMLHELLFSHCTNKSDHAISPAAERARDIIDRNCPDTSRADAASQKYREASRSLRPLNLHVVARFDPGPDNTIFAAGYNPRLFAQPPPSI